MKKRFSKFNFFLVSCMTLVFMMAFGGAVSAAPVEFEDVVLPFTVVDMLTTATNFLTMYGEWILLVLGVIFAPVLYGLAMKLVSAARAKMAAK